MTTSQVSVYPRAEWEELVEGEDYSFGAYGRLLVVVWGGPVRAAACRLLAEECRKFVAASGGKRVAVLSIGLVNIRPDESARRELQSLIEDSNGLIHRSAVVHLIEGFVTATMRSVVTSLRLVIGRPTNHLVFTTVDEALPWVLDGLSGAPDASSATVAVRRRLRELHGVGVIRSGAPSAYDRNGRG